MACALTLLSACSENGPPADDPLPPDPSTVSTEPQLSIHELAECPIGDEIWFKNLELADRGDRSDLERVQAEAAQCAEQEPDRWEPLWVIGECLFRRGLKDHTLFEGAKPPLEQALARAESLDDGIGVARATNRLGWLTRDVAASERLYRQGLDAAEQANRPDLACKLNGNLAGLLRRTGRLAEAVSALGAAIDLQKRAEAAPGLSDDLKSGLDKVARAFAYNRAILLMDLGNLVQSREALDVLSVDASEAGDARMIAKADLSRGNIHRLLDESAEAEFWLSKVPSDIADIAAAAELNLGNVALRDGRLDESRVNLGRAIAQDANPLAALLGKIYLADLELRSSRTGVATQSLETTISEAEEQQAREQLWMARSIYGKCLMTQPGRTADAVLQFQESMDILEGQGSGLNPAVEGIAYLRERAEPFADLAAALAQSETDESARILEVVERAHARGLRRVLQGSEPVAPDIPELAELQAGLSEGELLVDFLIGKDRGVVLAVASDRVRAEPLPGWNELRKPLRRFRAALTRPLIAAEARLDPEADLRRDIERGKELRRTLLGPVQDMLDEARRVYVVPDQDLALLPLAALPLDSSGSSTVSGPLRFLGDEKEIAVMPMAGTPSEWRALRTPILLAGNPLADPAGEFPALPLAGEELSRIRSVWGKGTWTELQGSRLALADLGALTLDRFGILHFATHAVASSLDPRRCAVILSRGEKLNMQRIAEMRLGPSLVVLSACRTGEGEIIPGEGVVGLSWAFLRAGARGVAASLWSVEDESTTELMVGFHRELKSGTDPVAAMARAQRAVSASRRHPAYWAPFVVILSPESGV